MSVAQTIVVATLATLVVLAILEGLASFWLSFRDRPRVLWATGRKRSSYDADLGWINRPNTYIPDMYGPGRYLKINSQGFRNDHEFAPVVAKGRLRVVCSGDSFAFGEGVANDKTWCEVLGQLDPRLEPLNLGQTGYGID